QPVELWHRGRRVPDVTSEPGLSGGVKSLAELYDLQWQQPKKMLFDAPDGENAGRSFMIPKTIEELASIGDMMLTWSRHTFVIMGARMLATLPISDEIMVFPSTLLKATEEDAPYAFGFAIPNATPGLKFLCRETMDYGRGPYDHPLGARFEELDAVVIFDDVF